MLEKSAGQAGAVGLPAITSNICCHLLARSWWAEGGAVGCWGPPALLARSTVRSQEWGCAVESSGSAACWVPGDAQAAPLPQPHGAPSLVPVNAASWCLLLSCIPEIMSAPGSRSPTRHSLRSFIWDSGAQNLLCDMVHSGCASSSRGPAESCWSWVGGSCRTLTETCCL